MFTLLFAFLLLLGGCKQDDFANETMDEYGKLASDIESDVKGAEDKKAGVAKAQERLDAAKAELGPKMTKINELRGFQVSEETMSKITSTVTDATLEVSGLQLELMMEVQEDPELETALNKLISDFEALTTGGG